jgi:hypothetical protein
MYWWRLLLELRLLLLSTAYSGLGPLGSVLGAAALPEPSFKIPGPRSRSQGQVLASGDPTVLPLGLAHFELTCRLLALADYSYCGKTGPRPQIMSLSTTRSELGVHSPAPGPDSLLGLLAYSQSSSQVCFMLVSDTKWHSLLGAELMRMEQRI